MKKIKKILACVLALMLMITSQTTIFGYEETSGETASRYIRAIIDKVYENYRFDADKDAMYKAVLDYVMKENPELLEGAIRASMSTLDPYSEYFSVDEMEAFVDLVETAYVGIGVTIVQVSEGIEITEVNENGGAYEAGVIPGDIIFEVDGKNIVGMNTEEVSELVRGESDTYVTIKVHREQEDLSFTILRKRIYNETVAYSVHEEDKIGYIYISKFSSSTPESVKKALDDIESQGINKLLIDVRGNPGGELSSVVDVLSYFVPKNKVLTKIQYNEEKRNTEIKSTATFSKTPNRKIIVLADEDSASAAELFTGAMQNLKLAKVVGVTTYGKGSMQNFMKLINPAGFNLGDIKLSIAEFTKPDGSRINGVGIEPDVWVKNVYEPYDASKLTPMTISDRYSVGDEGEDVRAIEERLSVLGYFSGEADDKFDEQTKTATEKFQSDSGLFSYGVMDYTTQNALNDRIAEAEVLKDRQFDKAYEMLLKE